MIAKFTVRLVIATFTTVPALANAASLDCAEKTESSDKFIVVVGASPRVLELRTAKFRPLEMKVTEVRSNGSVDVLSGTINMNEGMVCAGGCPLTKFELKLSASNMGSNGHLTVKSRNHDLTSGPAEEIQNFELTCAYSGWTAISP